MPAQFALPLQSAWHSAKDSQPKAEESKFKSDSESEESDEESEEEDEEKAVESEEESKYKKTGAKESSDESSGNEERRLAKAENGTAAATADGSDVLERLLALEAGFELDGGGKERPKLELGQLTSAKEHRRGLQTGLQ